MSNSAFNIQHSAFAIQAVQLRKSFGPTVAVAQLDLSVSLGQIVGLIGPDGAGKTTTLRLLTGALRADSGQAHVAGVDVIQQPDKARQVIGYMSQRFSLYGDLSIDENIRFFADVHATPVAERRALTERLLSMTQLLPFRGRRAAALSGGMKQKLALACALIHSPQVLLLDEPTTGVDPVSRREFWDVLGEAVAQNKLTILLATPSMDEADRCHCIGFMRAGHMLAYGTPRELQERVPGTLLELRPAPAPPLLHALLAHPSISDAYVVGDRLRVLSASQSSADEILALLTALGLTITTARSVTPSMDDVYRFLQRREGAQEVGTI